MPTYRRKLNRYQMAQFRKQKYQQDMSGEGVYIFENSNKNADLTLPRPTKSGLRRIGPGKQFEGDSYYMQLVQTGFLRLIREVKEEKVKEEKMIFDQPDIYNEQGKVEHTVKTPVQKINESGNEKQPDILLNESPVDDGFIIVEDD